MQRTTRERGGRGMGSWDWGPGGLREVGACGGEVVIVAVGPPEIHIHIDIHIDIHIHIQIHIHIHIDIYMWLRFRHPESGWWTFRLRLPGLGSCAPHRACPERHTATLWGGDVQYLYSNNGKLL